ncbi:MAG: hypothetical protein PQJ60_10795 [Spirochaetales bacterium]|nr:hypothetical protein [Spirochaetales bacterium]
MEIPEAEINEFGVAVNTVILKRWGDDKSFYEIKAAKYKGKILAGYNYRLHRDSAAGGGGPAAIDSHNGQFESISAAIEDGKKHALRCSIKNPKDYRIIRQSIAASEQLELFS